MRETGPLIVQIVPPGAGGVHDYQACLRKSWLDCGIDARTIELSKGLAAERSLCERVDSLRAERGTDRCSVVVHYSGYGYGHRGVCLWLLHELKTLRTRYGARMRLVIVFHELYAFGPPTGSAFWLSPLQASIAARLARMADAMWTNTDHHAAWLRRVVGHSKPLRVHPVFSNIGEACRWSPPSTRSRRVTVFGSAATRQRALSSLRNDTSVLAFLGIDEMVEVGPGSACDCAWLTIPHRHVGRLDSPELAAVLDDSRFGLLDYPPQYLGKSSVFAAYAAFGCVVLNTASAGRDADGLAGGRDYLALSGISRSRETCAQASHLDAMATSLHHWYASHPLADQAQQLLALAME